MHGTPADPDTSWQRKAILGGAPVSCTLRDRSPELPSDTWAEENRGKLYLPCSLVAEGSVIGGLLVYSEEWDAFDEKETDLLQQAANDVAQGMVLFQTRAARTAAENSATGYPGRSRTGCARDDDGRADRLYRPRNQSTLAAVVTNANASPALAGPGTAGT